jgi:hypothetical protein
MPYRVGAKGSYGCSGYPALKEGTNEVMGCHTTRADAAGQIYAINRSEGNIGKSMPNLKEGDFAMTAHGGDEEFHIGQVVHVMREGMLGIPGGEYTLEATPENPAVLIQLFEQEESGYWEATRLYSACMMSLFIPIDPLPMEVEDSEVAMAMYDAEIGKAYEGCGCPTCKELNVNCENCPVCQEDMEKAKKPNYSEIIQPRSVGSKPSNPKLYARVVQAAKDKFEVYPSAVANSWVVQEYKRRGGTYKSEKQLGSDNFWNGFLK